MTRRRAPVRNDSTRCVYTFSVQEPHPAARTMKHETHLVGKGLADWAALEAAQAVAAPAALEAAKAAVDWAAQVAK